MPRLRSDKACTEQPEAKPTCGSEMQVGSAHEARAPSERDAKLPINKTSCTKASTPISKTGALPDFLGHLTFWSTETSFGTPHASSAPETGPIRLPGLRGLCGSAAFGAARMGMMTSIAMLFLAGCDH